MTCLIEFNISEHDYCSEDVEDPLIINSNISGFKNMTQKSSWAMTK